MSYVDDHGDQLTGERTYTLRLDPEPPVSAFWSLTMYSVPDFYLVENPIERYSIGDRTPGLVRDEDGALTITISHERRRREGGGGLASLTGRRLPTGDADVRARPRRARGRYGAGDHTIGGVSARTPITPH